MRLLQRTTRSVGLTEAGARFGGELRDRPAGTLRLTLPRLGYVQVLAPKLAVFLAAYADIDFDISIDDAFVNIIDQGFDAGIRIGEMVEREMIGVRVSHDLRTAVVVSPAYFASHQKPMHPRDLHAHNCINYRRRALGVIYRWEFTENGKDFEMAVNGRLLLNDGELMVQAALDGLGLAYVLEGSVRVELEGRRLVRVLDSFCTPFPGFFLYYPSRAHVAPKLQALVDFLKVRRDGSVPNRQKSKVASHMRPRPRQI